MRTRIIWNVLIVVLLLFPGCDEGLEMPVRMDSVPPGPVEIESVVPVAGGFDVSYILPDDEDLLYVKAEFNVSETKTSEVKVSLYRNDLTVLGFGDTLPKTVTLYAVDRSDNVSEGTAFTEQPLVDPATLIHRTIRIEPDFGGAKFTWENPTEAPVAILIFAQDSTGEMENVHTIYTSTTEGRYSLRGYEPEPTAFYALVKDRWDHLTAPKYPDTEDGMITPFYEAKLDKSKFRKVILPTDTNWDAWEGRYESAYDNDYQSFVHSQGDHPMPQIFTIDLGVKVRLSRFKVFQRGLSDNWWAFTHGNPMEYTVYGAMDLGNGEGNLADWIKLRDCESFKPSGLPVGQVTDEDMTAFYNGDEFSFEVPVEIRYFRIAIHSTWDGAGFINFSELDFWGDIIEEYN